MNGVDVSDRCLCLSVHSPGTCSQGTGGPLYWSTTAARRSSSDALLDLFSGRLGGPIADLAGLVREVVAVERVPIAFDVVDGRGHIEIGDVAEAQMAPFLGATGLNTYLHDSAFATVPGSPAFVAKADRFRRDGCRHGLPNVAIMGYNAVQGSFRFSA